MVTCNYYSHLQLLQSLATTNKQGTHLLTTITKVQPEQLTVVISRHSQFLIGELPDNRRLLHIIRPYRDVSEEEATVMVHRQLTLLALPTHGCNLYTNSYMSKAIDNPRTGFNYSHKLVR